MATSMFAKARKRLRRAAKHLEIDPDVVWSKYSDALNYRGLRTG